jgi:hypothetical protein
MIEIETLRRHVMKNARSQSPQLVENLPHCPLTIAALIQAMGLALQAPVLPRSDSDCHKGKQRERPGLLKKNQSDTKPLIARQGDAEHSGERPSAGPIGDDTLQPFFERLARLAQRLHLER